MNIRRRKRREIIRFEDMTVRELLKYAETKGIDIGKARAKGEIISNIVKGNL